MHLAVLKNSHEASQSLTPLRDITPQEYLIVAKKWKNSGATIIGGCCGIMPDHIQALNKLRK